MSASRLIGCLALGALAVGGAAPAAAQAPPSEERLMEQIERARRAFQDGASAAPEQPQAGERQLIEDVRGLKERLGAAPSEQEAPIDPAAAAKVRKRLADELNVEVLDIRPIEIESGGAYAVKIMNPGGNSNDAFMVSTLIVDRESGRVLGQLRRSIGTAAGFSESGVRFQPGVDGSGLTIRQRTYR